MKVAWDPNRWVYRVTEISNLRWEAIADDQQGTVIRQVSWEVGPDELLQRAKDEAADLTQRRREAARRSG